MKSAGLLNSIVRHGAPTPTDSNAIEERQHMPSIYRLIYKKHFGSIPVDDNGISYDIHHIDGNRKNNELSNLKAVSLQEHYDIHFNQGDWMACQRILKRMDDDPVKKSILLSKSNKQRVENGTHNFMNPEWCKESSERRSDTWEITFPDGETIVRKNLKTFCKENNLNQGAMNQVGLGRIEHHKGFRCRKLRKGEIRGKEAK
jgi:hypothetical protein